MSTQVISAVASHPLSAAAAAAAKKPFIDWAALGKVAGVSFVFGIAVVVLFSVGIVGLSWMEGRGQPPGEPASLAGVDGGAQTAAAGGNRTLGAAMAAVCFAICAAAVLFGLWLIIPQFH